MVTRQFFFQKTKHKISIVTQCKKNRRIRQEISFWHNPILKLLFFILFTHRIHNHFHDNSNIILLYPISLKCFIFKMEMTIGEPNCRQIFLLLFAHEVQFYFTLTVLLFWWHDNEIKWHSYPICSRNLFFIKFWDIA